MTGHRPDGSARPYSNDAEHCECGVELQYDGDYTEQYWSPVDGDPSAPCPVHDAPAPPDPAAVRAMFKSFGWGVTDPS